MATIPAVERLLGADQTDGKRKKGTCTLKREEILSQDLRKSEYELIQWIQAVLNDEQPQTSSPPTFTPPSPSSSSSSDLWLLLNDGTILCKLYLKLFRVSPSPIPTAVTTATTTPSYSVSTSSSVSSLASASSSSSNFKFNTQPRLPFKRLENITIFLDAIRKEKVLKEQDLFETSDLFEQKNLGKVITCLTLLKRLHDLQTQPPPPHPDSRSSSTSGSYPSSPLPSPVPSPSPSPSSSLSRQFASASNLYHPPARNTSLWTVMEGWKHLTPPPSTNPPTSGPNSLVSSPHNTDETSTIPDSIVTTIASSASPSPTSPPSFRSAHARTPSIPEFHTTILLTSQTLTTRESVASSSSPSPRTIEHSQNQTSDNVPSKLMANSNPSPEESVIASFSSNDNLVVTSEDLVSCISPIGEGGDGSITFQTPSSSSSSSSTSFTTLRLPEGLSTNNTDLKLSPLVARSQTADSNSTKEVVSSSPLSVTTSYEQTTTITADSWPDELDLEDNDEKQDKSLLSLPNGNGRRDMEVKPKFVPLVNTTILSKVQPETTTNVAYLDQVSTDQKSPRMAGTVDDDEDECWDSDGDKTATAPLRLPSIVPLSVKSNSGSLELHKAVDLADDDPFSDEEDDGCSALRAQLSVVAAKVGTIAEEENDPFEDSGKETTSTPPKPINLRSATNTLPSISDILQSKEVLSSPAPAPAPTPTPTPTPTSAPKAPSTAVARLEAEIASRPDLRALMNKWGEDEDDAFEDDELEDGTASKKLQLSIEKNTPPKLESASPHSSQTRIPLSPNLLALREKWGEDKPGKNNSLSVLSVGSPPPSPSPVAIKSLNKWQEEDTDDFTDDFEDNSGPPKLSLKALEADESSGKASSSTSSLEASKKENTIATTSGNLPLLFFQRSTRSPKDTAYQVARTKRSKKSSQCPTPTTASPSTPSLSTLTSVSLAPVSVSLSSVVTWATWNDQVTRIARNLLLLGIQPGNRVCFATPMCPQWYSLFIGTLAVGGVGVFFPHDLIDTARLSYVLNHSRPRVLLLEGSPHLHRLLPAIQASTSLTHIFLLSNSHTGSTVDDPIVTKAGKRVMLYSFLQFLRVSKHLPSEEEASRIESLICSLTGPQMAAVYYSLSSSDPNCPKATVLSHENLVWTAKELHRAFMRQRNSANKLGSTPPASFSSSSPLHAVCFNRLFNLSQFLIELLVPSLCGGVITFLDTSDLASAIRFVKPTLVCCNPILLNTYYKSLRKKLPAVLLQPFVSVATTFSLLPNYLSEVIKQALGCQSALFVTPFGEEVSNKPDGSPIDQKKRTLLNELDLCELLHVSRLSTFGCPETTGFTHVVSGSSKPSLKQVWSGNIKVKTVTKGCLVSGPGVALGYLREDVSIASLLNQEGFFALPSAVLQYFPTD